MITRDDVIHFYKKYKENLKKEEQVTATLMQADSQEEWVEKLRQKHRILRQLYIENEALLNLYVRPLMEGRAEITEDTAKAFIDQIWQAHLENFEDNLSMMEMAETLEDYFREHGPLEYYIWDLSILGILYNGSSEQEEGRKGYEYFKKICALSDHYFEIEDFEVRKRIIYAFYNRCILQVNFFLGDETEMMANLDQALAFYRSPEVLALDGGRFDFDGLIEELNYDTFGNYIMAHNRENADPQTLERAKKVLGVYYHQCLAENPNPYAMPDEIYCYYKITLFFLGRITCTEFLDDYKRFCDYSIEHDTLSHPDSFIDSRLFQVATNHLPGILQYLNLYQSEYQGDPFLRRSCVESYLKIIRQIPRAGNSRFVNDVIGRSLYKFAELLTAGDAEFDILINVMLNRDEITLVHSQMVEQIAEILLNAVLDQKPELLVGSLGCETVVDVLEKREQFAAFLSQAAKLFDLGKLKDADIVNKQSRQLTAAEFSRIYAHPQAGADIIQRVPALLPFRDIILGHHKSWDGTMGYPESFDNTVSRYRFLIELIHISDCMDAATDFIGRSYKTAKSFSECLQEFSQGKGTLYCPEIIRLIEDGPALQETLRHLLGEGRIHTYYEVYGIALDENAGSITIDSRLPVAATETEQLINILHESGQENYNFVHAMVRHSLLTLYVDLRSGRFHVISRGKQRLFGGLPDGFYPDFLNDHLQHIVLPKDWAKLKYQLTLSELVHTLARQDGTYECEMRILQNGTYRWTRMQFTKLDEQNIIPRTMAVIISDVQEVHSRSDQMESVLKDAYQTAIEASKAKSIFLSSMSHDIRTPMNGIMGMTQIALQHLDNPERVQDCLKKIDESSHHLLELINEVLDMSRIESGKTILHPEPVVLRELMDGVINVCRPGILAADQKLILHLEELGTDCVLVDPVRLRQIFTNILSNSVKYTPQEGTIQILARRLSTSQARESCYQFVFQDNGIGMSREFQQKLFEPFTREDNSMTNAAQGTGLGLSIVRSMIAIMGGTIDVASTQGVGTTFTITLQFPHAEKPVEKEESSSLDFHFDGRRILLAEDNELNREIAVELLSSTGLTVETAKDGRDALMQFKKNPDGYYDLILMDIRMPVMNGYDATRAIRALPGKYAAEIPILALTANIFQDDIIEAMESGMNEHLTKPIDLRKIGMVLQKWLPDFGSLPA